MERLNMVCQFGLAFAFEQCVSVSSCDSSRFGVLHFCKQFLGLLVVRTVGISSTVFLSVLD